MEAKSFSFVFHNSGDLKKLEDRETPRAVFGIVCSRTLVRPEFTMKIFRDLAGFGCPEWSHLSAGDSVEFSKRLIPHLRAALEM